MHEVAVVDVDRAIALIGGIEEAVREGQPREGCPGGRLGHHLGRHPRGRPEAGVPRGIEPFRLAKMNVADSRRSG